MVRNAWLGAVAMAVMVGLAPNEASACRDPSNKIAAISVALEKATLSDETRAEVTALRDKARGWRLPGQYAEAQAAAEKALQLLKVKYREPAATSRC
jgi:hypothetical protein